MSKLKNNIALIGFSATGKTSVAKAVASQLGWTFADSDTEIEKVGGKNIPQLFKEEGEAKFRELEQSVIKHLCKQKNVVIATGGGTVIDRQSRDFISRHCVVVRLEARADTIYQRLYGNDLYTPNKDIRPLLENSDPLNRIKQLKSERIKYYAFSDWTVHTDDLNIADVSKEVIRGWEYIKSRHSNNSKNNNSDLTCYVDSFSRRYPVYVGWGLLDKVGDKLKGAGLSGTTIIISDKTVYPIYGTRVTTALKNRGFIVKSYIVPAGEISKTINQAMKIYNFLVEQRVERSDIIIALGGGMIGDLAGFVAATFLRGLPLVHIPTSLVGMSDASIGGKVAVNHHQGKNLIGSFYQPVLVLADAQTLTTLPKRELISGWAEVIKHGLILDADLLALLETSYTQLTQLIPEITTRTIAWSVQVKASIIRKDEKETGLREILNYGHTIGHGLEAAGKYTKFLHGEAVAIGMMGAAKLSNQLGLISSHGVTIHRKILGEYGLPINCSGINPEDVFSAMELDKKKREQNKRWVLLEDIGKVIIKNDIQDKYIKKILSELITN